MNSWNIIVSYGARHLFNRENTTCLQKGSDLYLLMIIHKPQAAKTKSKLCYYKVWFYQHVSIFALGKWCNEEWAMKWAMKTLKCRCFQRSSAHRKVNSAPCCSLPPMRLLLQVTNAAPWNCSGLAAGLNVLNFTISSGKELEEGFQTKHKYWVRNRTIQF